MGDNITIEVQGLARLNNFLEVPEKLAKAAVRAVNKTIERARPLAAREIQEQVNLPARYLSGQDGRLKVTKKAQGDDLEAILTGRSRPTSLARFSTGSTTTRKPGVRVSVQPGLARFLPKAFFIRLRAGTDSLDTRSNLGLAIRLPAGKMPSRAYKPKAIGNGVWLLYGPSVDQVFKSVAEDIAPDLAVFLEDEYLRLIEVDLAI